MQSNRRRPPHFGHVFSGGYYASAYYSYMWSEVLDADAFDAFHLADDAQERGEIGTIGDVFAVAVHDLAEERDFFHAAVGKPANFGDNFGDGPAGGGEARAESGAGGVGAGAQVAGVADSAAGDRAVRRDGFA